VHRQCFPKHIDGTTLLRLQQAETSKCVCVCQMFLFASRVALSVNHTGSTGLCWPPGSRCWVGSKKQCILRVGVFENVKRGRTAVAIKVSKTHKPAP